MFKPGDRVFIQESMTLGSITPARIGTVLDDLDDVVYVQLDEIVSDVPVLGDVVQWTDPEDAVVEVEPEQLRPIIG